MSKCTCLRCGEDRDYEARGLCAPCYKHVHGVGQVAQYPKQVRRTLAYWISLIDRSDPDACWPWPGPMHPKGYGKAIGPAHRDVYVRMVGPIAEGLHIDHTCHNDAKCSGGVNCPHRRCVNWEKHLRPVTPRENLLASPNTVNAVNAARTECPRNHPYDAENTAYRNGRRKCKACDRERRRRNYHANIDVERLRKQERRLRARVVTPKSAPQVGFRG